MSLVETGCLIALLFAFYITVIHPFIVGACIVGIVLYFRYFVAKSSQKTLEHTTRSTDVPLDRKETFYSEASSESLKICSEDEESPRAIEEKKKKKSQQEILREIQEYEERKKYSKLLLTYQVPNMTAYYESLMQIVQN
uniref:PXA domain-containing protein n=1 Tax=Angiostrongylus cantonensis TaxID=6313 RepID=A0A0K0D3Q8_ANGCA